MMMCAFCGATFVKEAAKFCNRCGKKRDAGAAPPPLAPRAAEQLPQVRPASDEASRKPQTPKQPEPASEPSPLDSTRRPSDATPAPVDLPLPTAPKRAAAKTCLPLTEAPEPSLAPKASQSLRNYVLVRQLLQDAELEHYAALFEQGRVDDACVKFVSEADLEKIGVALGAHRKKLLELIARKFPSSSSGSMSGTADDNNNATSSSFGHSGGGNTSRSAASTAATAFNAALTTLKPDGISPEMLQTENSEDFRGWRQGPLLGKGSYGAVYLALLPCGRFYAVKKIELGGAQGIKPAELVALSREITMMRRLSHPNICQFTGCRYEAADNAVLMFMEYVSGGSLASVVRKFRPLPEELLQAWTIQLLRGLAYLHSQHCMHRDVKPENCCVDLNPASLSAAIKLADFGAAKRLGDAVSHSSTVCGTPYYLAPEVVLSTEGYDAKADVWSVGCTVCEMVSGKPPWPSKSNLPAAIMMIAQSPDGPTEIPVESMSEQCLAFVRSCFVRDPVKRPSAVDLLRHPWLADHPLQKEAE